MRAFRRSVFAWIALLESVHQLAVRAMPVRRGYPQRANCTGVDGISGATVGDGDATWTSSMRSNRALQSAMRDGRTARPLKHDPSPPSIDVRLAFVLPARILSSSSDEHAQQPELLRPMPAPALAQPSVAH